MYIRTSEILQRLCQQAKAEGVVALDLEFIRERSYIPQLALAQIAVRDTCAIVDPLAIATLKPLLDLVYAPDIVKVLHAAGQDMEVLFRHFRRPPVCVFDTQIAAAFAGLGEQVSYGRLVEKLLGVSLAKTESYSDWLQRPLAPEQVSYALDDVRYLLPLYDALVTRLEQLQRRAWAEEEFLKLEALDLYERAPRSLFQRIRRGTSLSSEALAILRELADWRDQEARRRNRPPGNVLRDEALVDLARKAPTTLDDLQRIRSFPPREITRLGPMVVAMVQRGLTIPAERRPMPQRKVRLREAEELTVRFLDAYLKSLCHAAKLPPSRVATRADLEVLVEQHRQGRLNVSAHALLNGWRGDLIGQKLLAVLEGRVSLYLNPQSGKLEHSQRRQDNAAADSGDGSSSP